MSKVQKISSQITSYKKGEKKEKKRSKMNNTPQETENPVTTYLRDNSRKKSYVEATLDAIMHETELEDKEIEVDEEVETEFERTGKIGEDEVQPREEDQMNEAEWEYMCQQT